MSNGNVIIIIELSSPSVHRIRMIDSGSTAAELHPIGRGCSKRNLAGRFR
jgi:hypothetical protein